MTKQMLHLGWYQKRNGKEVAIHYQSANGDIGYRYKGTRQIRNSSRASFLKRFANYNDDSPRKAAAKRIPIMERMCEACPFHDAGWKDVREFLKERARTEASPICHSTGSGALTKKKHNQSHLCRGARNYMLELFHRSGFLEAATDAAWDKKCAEMGIKPDTCK